MKYIVNGEETGGGKLLEVEGTMNESRGPEMWSGGGVGFDIHRDRFVPLQDDLPYFVVETLSTSETPQTPKRD